MKRKNRYIPKSRTLAAVLAIGVLLPGCQMLPNAGVESPSQEQYIKTIKAERITKQKIGDPVEIAGEIVSSVQVSVSTKIDGDVAKIFKHRGDAVKEGEVLAQLTSNDLALEREKAQLAYRQAQDALARARSEGSQLAAKAAQDVENAQIRLNQLKNKYDVGMAASAEVDAAESLLQSARLAMNLERQQLASAISAAETAANDAKMKLQESEQAWESLQVKAPLSGILTEMPIVAGMTVSAGTEIGIIENLDAVKIRVQLSVDAVKFVRGKEELSYYLPETEQKLKGKIGFLASVIDPKTQAYELTLDVPNQDQKWKPGMRVRVQLTDEDDQIVVAVPTTSIVKEENNDFVFVVTGDTVEKRRVQLGRINEPYQEVLSGVKENELLVIMGQNQLKNLDKIRLATGSEQA